MSDNETANVPVDEEEKAIKSPEELALLQEMPDMKAQAMSAYRKLPKPVKRRVKALKKLLNQKLEMEADYHREVHELERKFLAKQRSLFERRRDIINGDIEPTDDDCDWPSDEEEDTDLAKQLTDKVIITEEKPGGDKPADEIKEDGDKENESSASGIPNFWLTFLTNLELTQEMIQDCDIPVLEKLTDITYALLDPDCENKGFRLEFHFASNDYFTNTVLTKEFYMRFDPSPEDPLAYEGPEVVRCKGCTINWKKDKNITVKTVRRMKKVKGVNKPITRTVQTDSFFNFFNPEELGVEGDQIIDDETESLIQAEFEIGLWLRERGIQRAVLYFTGEALEDEYEEEEEDEEEMGDEEDDDDDDERPPRGGRSKQHQQVQQNCKQQ